MCRSDVSSPAYRKSAVCIKSVNQTSELDHFLEKREEITQPFFFLKVFIETINLHKIKLKLSKYFQSMEGLYVSL